MANLWQSVGQRKPSKPSLAQRKTTQSCFLVSVLLLVLQASLVCGIASDSGDVQAQRRLQGPNANFTANCTVPETCSRALDATEYIDSLSNCCWLSDETKYEQDPAHQHHACYALPQKCKDLVKCKNICDDSPMVGLWTSLFVVFVIFVLPCLCCGACCLWRDRKKKRAIGASNGTNAVSSLDNPLAQQATAIDHIDDLGCKPALKPNIICLDDNFTERYVRQDPCLQICYLPDEAYAIYTQPQRAISMLGGLFLLLFVFSVVGFENSTEMKFEEDQSDPQAATLPNDEPLSSNPFVEKIGGAVIGKIAHFFLEYVTGLTAFRYMRKRAARRGLNENDSCMNCVTCWACCGIVFMGLMVYVLYDVSQDDNNVCRDQTGRDTECHDVEASKERSYILSWQHMLLVVFLNYVGYEAIETFISNAVGVADFMVAGECCFG